MAGRHIRKIVIVGGGTAGWMTAAALSKVNTPRQFDIALVESDEIGAIGVGEATIPTIHWFNTLAGVSEADLIRHAKATFKLGIEFVNWNGPGSRYFHPFGRYGDAGDGPMFFHRWIRAWLADRSLSYSDASLTTALAMAGRFARPGQDPRGLASTLGYAYHLDASLYAQCLRKISQGRGVTRTEGRIERIEQHPESGFVTAVTTHRGDRLDGDLFIDCSGLKGLLIEDTLNSGFEDWSQWLPCDRAFAVPMPAADAVPFTRTIAHACGWQWQIPLQHRTGSGLVFSSRFTGEDEARDTLLSHLTGAAVTGEGGAEPRLIRFRTGRRRQAWNRNVVAIGLSAGFLEPLESTSIHLIQSGIAKLLSLFPTCDCDPLTARQFNRIFEDEMRAVRDFLILHYRWTAGQDAPLWRYCQTMAVPDSLMEKEALFRRTGRIVLQTDELFRDASWFAVMMGQGLRPEDFNPLAKAYSEPGDLRHFAQLREKIAREVTMAPPHMQVVRSLAGAPENAVSGG